MNKNVVLAGGVLALVGLIVNPAGDFDNEYDMTLAALWALTVILFFVGVPMGAESPPGAERPETMSKSTHRAFSGVTVAGIAILAIAGAAGGELRLVTVYTVSNGMVSPASQRSLKKGKGPKITPNYAKS